MNLEAFSNGSQLIDDPIPETNGSSTIWKQIGVISKQHWFSILHTIQRWFIKWKSKGPKIDGYGTAQFMSCWLNWPL